MKKIISIVLALTLLCCFTGCNQSDSGASKEVIRVGTMCNHIGLPIYYAMENGLFEEAGLNVELYLFPTGAPINEALAADELDVANSGMASVYALSTGNTYWLGDIDDSGQGLGIYVRPDSPILEATGNATVDSIYGSEETVRGITILGTAGTSDQYNADKYVAQFGLTNQDYQFLNMERGPAVQAFISGEGDAIACGDTTFMVQLENAGCIMVGSMSDCAGMGICDGMIATKSFVDSRPEDAKAYVEVIYKAVDILATDENARFEIAKKFYDENARGMSDDDIYTEIETKRYITLDDLASGESLFGSTMVGMGDFYIEDGKIEAGLWDNITGALYTKFVSELTGVDIAVATVD